MATANVIAANIATIRAARRQRAPKELIKAATIATALDKQTGAVLGWAVKSNSSEEYYQITFLTLEDGSHEFFCTCKSADYGFYNCRPDEQGNKCCCHILAVKSVLVAQAELATFLDSMDNFFLAASRYAFKQVCPPANNSRFAIHLKYTPAQVQEEDRAEVAQATIEQAEAILKEERRLAPLNDQSRKVEKTPWGTSVLMR